VRIRGRLRRRRIHAIFTTRPLGCARLQSSRRRTSPRSSREDVIFRIPTPVFGAGLIEQVPDARYSPTRPRPLAQAALGHLRAGHFSVSGRTVSGQANNNGNDGHHRALRLEGAGTSRCCCFSGEAYNGRDGISNELFQQERDETSTCQFATVPNDVKTPRRHAGRCDHRDREVRDLPALLAPPDASRSCRAGPIRSRADAAHSGTSAARCATRRCCAPEIDGDGATLQAANLFSDLLVHDMGPELATRLARPANGREFRTAPALGLGPADPLPARRQDRRPARAIRRTAAGARSPATRRRPTKCGRAFNNLFERQKQTSSTSCDRCSRAAVRAPASGEAGRSVC